MPEKLINPLNLSLEIKRHRKRRHLLLQVTQHSICVKAPYYSSKREIIHFVNSHQQWITKTHASLPKVPSYQNGEKLLHLGEYKKLVIAKGPTNIAFTDTSIDITFATTAVSAIAYLLKQTFVKHADIYLKERFDALTQLFPIKPASLTIKDFKSRWGSCDKEGHIQLNWRLIMSPPSVINYVIIHELCHLKYFNHSKAFWALVAHYHPSYQEDKHWLTAHQTIIKSAFLKG